MSLTILTQQQVAAVRDHLAAAGLSEPLSEELLDHLCCAIEARMDDGSDFPTALEATLRSWPLRHLRDIQQKIHFSTKIKPMLFRLSTAAALLAGIFFLSPSFGEVPAPTYVHVAAPTTPDDDDDVLFVPTFDPPTASPIAGVEMEDIMTSGYGMRVHPQFKRKQMHRGIDLKAATGTSVQATAAGRVIYAGNDGNYGITVRILHEDGYVTVFAHLSEHAVERGDRVMLGQKIGAVGSTGKSTAPHLHYEVLKDDVPVNPLALLEE